MDYFITFVTTDSNNVQYFDVRLRDVAFGLYHNMLEYCNIKEIMLFKRGELTPIEMFIRDENTDD